MPDLTTPSSSSSPPLIPNLDVCLGCAVAFAEVDWQIGTREEYPSSRDSPLAKIFRDSGYSSVGVEPDDGRDGDIDAWCGLAVAAWLHRAGLPVQMRRTFYHRTNVLDCLTYKQHPTNSERTKNWIQAAGRRLWLRDYHEKQSVPRIWQGYDDVQQNDLDDLDVKPGYIVLIDHDGDGGQPDHITMAYTWQPPILTTIEGNATGLDAGGNRIHQAVVINHRDLSRPRQRARIFGIGCLSPLDFADLDYRS